MYKRFLPSKVVTALFLIPIFSIVLFFVLKDNIADSPIEEKNSRFNLVKALEEELTKKDGDSDGLLDWEERLYETDIDNPDSDGDGVLDGLEVKTGTNPVDPFNKESRKSEIKKVISGDNEYNYRDDMELTQTDKLSRDLFVKIAELKGSNLINNNSAQNKIIEEVIERNLKEDIPVEVKDIYTKKDLIISRGLSVNEFKNSFVDVYNKQEWKNVQNEMPLLIKYSETDDKEVFDKLSKNALVYTKYKEDLLKTPVPEMIHSPFLQYINSVNEYLYIIKKIVKSADDPVGLINYSRALQISLEKNKFASELLSSFFTENNI